MAYMIILLLFALVASQELDCFIGKTVVCTGADGGDITRPVLFVHTIIPGVNRTVVSSNGNDFYFQVYTPNPIVMDVDNGTFSESPKQEYACTDFRDNRFASMDGGQYTDYGNGTAYLLGMSCQELVVTSSSGSSTSTSGTTDDNTGTNAGSTSDASWLPCFF